jgi:hypothetical protein
MQAFELRGVYKPHRPTPVARLELVSAQFTQCLIDALEDTMLAFLMGNKFAHLSVGGITPLLSKQNEYIPPTPRTATSTLPAVKPTSKPSSPLSARQD